MKKINVSKSHARAMDFLKIKCESGASRSQIKRVQMNKASLQKLNIAQAYPSLPIVDYVPFLDGGRKLDERKRKFGVCSNSLGKGSEFANSLGERDVV